MKALRKKISIGVVGGSDLVKQMEQLGDSPQLFDYCFPENGLLVSNQSLLLMDCSYNLQLVVSKYYFVIFH